MNADFAATSLFFFHNDITVNQSALKHLNNSTWTHDPLPKTKREAHLFGLAAGRSQQEGVENVLPSQEEAIAVLIQEDGSEGQLAVVTAEDGRSVGGQ